MGKYQQPVSRYKCMFIFLRPCPRLKDENTGEIVVGKSPGKTNCILPKGHDSAKYPHTNIRGEQPGGKVIAVSKLRTWLKDLRSV